MVKTVDEYLNQHAARWGHILSPLRDLLRATPMTESIKWGAPVYVLDRHNVVGLAAFKAYAGMWFFDGAFLADAAGVLINAQKGKTRGMRQWRFGPQEEVPLATAEAYILEAMANVRAGRVTQSRQRRAAATPELLEAALQRDASLRSAYDGLTQGRKNEYCEYLTDAKREATRVQRLQKILPMIAAGTGLNDRYK